MLKQYPLVAALWLGACFGSEATDPASESTDADLLASVTDATADAAAEDLCPDGFPRGVAGPVRQVAPLSPAPEGVAACANGDVFVSIPDRAQILRVPLDGTAPEVWATLTGHSPLGMTCFDNELFVVDFGSKNASVFRVSAKNDSGTALPNLPAGGAYGAMNSVIAIDGLGIYATDRSTSFAGGRIIRWQLVNGVYQASVVKSGLFFPNDLVFNPNTQTLDVTLTLGGEVLSYPVVADGSLGKVKHTYRSLPLLDAFDGVARDENNALYVAHYLLGYVGRPGFTKVAKLNQPRSLAFRGGTLLITGAKGLYAAPLGVCGFK